MAKMKKNSGTKANSKTKTPKATKVAKPAKAKGKAPVKAAAKETVTKSLTKGVVSAVGKLFGKEKSAKPVAAKSVTPMDAKPAKKEKAGKKAKDAKKGKKEGFDLEEDDLLASDEEIGSEEIPDLSEFEETEVEEIESEESLDDGSIAAEMKQGDDEIVLTDAEGRRYCRVRDCDQISSVEGYCRYHYLLLWKRIQVRRKILADGKLERYVEELTSRYPDKFLEMIRKDLRTEKDFLNSIAELEIDESAGENEFEDEAQNFIDEVRGISTDTGSMTEEEEF